MTNVIVLEGNIVADAESKTVGETNLTEFKIANTRYISKGKEKTAFVKCKWWGQRGLSVQAYLVKGKRITVTGAMEIDEWEKNGQKKSMVVINVTDVSLGAKGSSSPAKQEYGDEKTTANSGSSTVSDGDFTDDIPF
jgi:single-strand DNA-binding protein